MNSSPSSRTARPPLLSVIMPVYNERGTIGEIIRRVTAVNVEKEIIIVDDFSTDGFREPAEVSVSRPQLRQRGCAAAWFCRGLRGDCGDSGRRSRTESAGICEADCTDRALRSGCGVRIAFS